MTTIEPKKLKLQIGKVKESLLQLKTNINYTESKRTRRAFFLLLISELLQRGTTLSNLPSLLKDDDEDNNNGNEEEKKMRTVLQIIQNSAGKALLHDVQTSAAAAGSTGDGGVPKLLVVGSAVISGMTAEACADCWRNMTSPTSLLIRNNSSSNSNSHSNTGTNDLDLETYCQTVQERCREVDDVRFLSLLQLATLSSSSSSSDIESEAVIPILLLRMAMGNHLRAASLSNPDQPAPWKKCLDTCLTLASLSRSTSSSKDLTQLTSKQQQKQQHQTEKENEEQDYKRYHTPDASIPLSNLIRIAQSKNNQKRVSELGLRLVESYLAPLSSSPSFFRDKNITLWDHITSCFVMPYSNDRDIYQNASNSTHDSTTPTQTTNPTNQAAIREKTILLQRIVHAQTALQNYCHPQHYNHDNDAEPSNYSLLLLYHLLRARIQLEEERAIVALLAAYRNLAAQRRSLDTDGASIGIGGGGGGGGIGGLSTKKGIGKRSSSSSLEDMERMVERNVFAKTLPQDEVETIASILGTYPDKYGEDGDGRFHSLRNCFFDFVSLGSNDNNNIDNNDNNNEGNIIHDLNGIEGATCKVLQDHIQRLIKRAQAQALTTTTTTTTLGKPNTTSKTTTNTHKSWEAILEHLTPILDRVANTTAALDTQPRYWTLLAENVSRSLVLIAWMLRDDASNVIPLHLLEMSTFKILSPTHAFYLAQEERKRKELRDKAENTVSSSSSSSSSLFSELSCALWAGECHCQLALASLTSLSNLHRDTTTHIQTTTATTLATIAKKSPSRIHHVMYGTPFVQFLVCWSGLHGPPWSFCTITQARSIVRFATDCLDDAESQWGRKASALERILVRLGQADAEGGLLPGGFVPDAAETYNAVLRDLGGGTLEKNMDREYDYGPVLELVQSHCLSGLSRIALAGSGVGEAATFFTVPSETDHTADSFEVSEKLAMMSLNKLQSLHQSLQDDGSSTMPYFYAWRSPDSFSTSLKFHICTARQLIAESLLRAGKSKGAQTFLDDAVKDSPMDYDAAFALGAFHLRMALYSVDDDIDGEREGFKSSTGRKRAQIQLLKAAKLDTSKADPFALLGVWYEVQNDVKRAIGCHSKALLLDSAHAVAGRGILRLKPYQDVATLCEAATNVSSPVNGWAWRAIGNTKAMNDGDDDIAILCYQQAMRCRDIESRQNETLGIFYTLPAVEKRQDYSTSLSQEECGATWSSLAGCYRRLGKYTASLRAFNSAFEATSGKLPASSLCAWAQVELELGLFDEAAVKFEDILSNEEYATSHHVAAYGVASCMHMIARRDLEEGKLGRALFHLNKGIDYLLKFVVYGDDKETMKSPFCCALKLIGDLYSFGALLPPSVFSAQGNVSGIDNIDAKLDFVAKGEVAYKNSLRMTEDLMDVDGDVDVNTSITVAACDVGTNLLCQARIVCESLNEGSGGEKTSLIEMPKRSERVKNVLDKAILYFKKAIDSNQLISQAWCGLGCALCATDPVLAQHAFCRALQLDKSSHDAWANIALLFVEYGEVDASAEAIDALTQVADTPLMWIGRGLLLEKAAVQGNLRKEELFCRAADAYRAALQVARHPSALLGLSLTSRRLGLENELAVGDKFASIANSIAGIESYANLSMYLHSTGESNSAVKMLGGIMTADSATKIWQEGNFELASELYSLGSESIIHGKEELDHNKLIAFKEGIAKGDDKLDIPILQHESSLERVISVSMKCAESLVNLHSSRKHQSINSKEQISIETAKCFVHENPDSGEGWLYLAKELTKEFTKIENPSNHSYNMILSASTKSKTLLNNEATNAALLQHTRPFGAKSMTSHKTVVSKTVKASVLAESLALYAWLQGLDNVDRSNDKSESCEGKLDFQKALLLDPENCLARAKLQQI